MNYIDAYYHTYEFSTIIGGERKVFKNVLTNSIHNVLPYLQSLTISLFHYIIYR